MSPRNTQFSRDEIIAAAFQIVREHGWSGFSVQTVAKAINSSTMPIYSQFANVRELEDEVCLKALEMLKERMLKVKTGDKWIDQAINYIGFAEEEKHLYRCIGDGRNVQLSMKIGKELVDFISATLADYPLFIGLAEHELKMIRVARMMFAQKLADWLNTNNNYLKEKGIEDTEDYIKKTSMALYEGFMIQFRADRQKDKHESGNA